MSEQDADFDTRREAYNEAQRKLFDLLETPERHLPVTVYRAHLKAALQAQQRAHKAMMAAWG